MCFEERIQQMMFIHEHIKKRKTGSYRELGARLNMSKSNIARIFETLRGCGAEIEFDTLLNSYYYKNTFDIELTIKR